MTETAHSDDQQLLQGLLEADPVRVRRIYQRILPMMIAQTKRLGGSEDDARDLFQEALLVLFRRVKKGDFRLTAALSTYLGAICRNLWLKRLRDQGETLKDYAEGLEPASSIDLHTEIEEQERNRIFYQHFERLEEGCQKILQLFFEKVPMKEIARQLGSTESYVKKRKFHCKERLIEAVKNDPAYPELNPQYP